MTRVRTLTQTALGALCALLIATLGVQGLRAQGYSTSPASPVQLTKTTIITAASVASAQRWIGSLVTLNPTSTITYTTTSIAAASGEIDLAAGKTMTDGFFYGTRGKFVGTTGTFNETSAGRITGIIGQADLGTMTITSGQVSGVWADLQGAGPTLTSTEVYPLRVSNSMTGTPDGLALFVGHATHALTLSDLGNGSSGNFVINASGTSAGQCAQTGGVVFTKTLKISADGTDYYIGLCTAP